MGWLVFYWLFSAGFTFGVTHGDRDRLFETMMKIILSILAGWFMMPIYLGSWLDLKR